MRIILIIALVSLFLISTYSSVSAQSSGMYYSKIILDSIPTGINAGDNVKFSGQLVTKDGRYVITRATVIIKDEPSVSSGTQILKLTTDSNGKFSGIWKAQIRSGGAYHFYAVYDGVSKITSAKAGWPSVVVTAKSSYSINTQSSYSSSSNSGSSSNSVTPTKYTKTYQVYADALPTWAYYAGNVMYESTRAWEDVNSGLKFYKAPSLNVADVHIAWVKEFGVEHVGYTLGKQYVEVGLGDSECHGKWQPYSGHHVADIMKHELGHVLGFQHSNDRNSIMYPIALNREYGLVQEEYTLNAGYAQFVPFCTIKDVTSYYYSVKSDNNRQGFDVYVVPSPDEMNKWSKTGKFSHYVDSSCYREGMLSFSNTCKNIGKGSGLLIVMNDDGPKNVLTKITVKQQEMS
ncbi:MAG: matrixin family metalloprotease [Nitrosarchaeum sp.]|nr:matrixin family metalloprotease [Nitrosarchaeum sp.]